MKLRFSEQLTREEPFHPTFYQADAHSSSPGAWYIRVAGRDFEVSTLLEASDTAEFAAMLDAMADSIALLLGGQKIESAAAVVKPI